MKPLLAARLGVLVLCLVSAGVNAGDSRSAVVIGGSVARVATDGDATNRQVTGVGTLVNAALDTVSRLLWQARDAQVARSALGQQPTSVLSAANYSVDADADKIGMRITWKF